MAGGIPAGRLSIELVAEVARLQADLDKAKKLVKQASGEIAASTKGANDNIARMGKEMGKTGGVSRVFGQQLSQVGQQVAAGTNALQAFAIQLPDIAVGLSQAGGAAGKFASFLGGPWGIAIATGLAVLAPFVSKLWESGEAAEDSANKLKGFADAAALSVRQREVVEMMSKLGELQNDFARKAGTSRQSQAFFANTVEGRNLAKQIELQKFAIDQQQKIIDLRADQIRQIDAAEAADKAAAEAKRLHNQQLREHNKALRDAAKAAREAAKAQKEFDKSVMGGGPLRELRNMGPIVSSKEIEASLKAINKTFSEELARRVNEWHAQMVDDAEADRQAQIRRDERSRNILLSTASDMGDIIGGKIGRALLDIVGILDRFFPKLMASLGKWMEDLFNSLPKILQEWLKGAAVGAFAAKATGGSAIGGMFGGALGKGLGGLLAPALGKFGALAGPLGAVAGGILGGVIGGLFKSVKKGSQTIEIIAGDAAKTSLVGNSAKLKAAASKMADGLISGLLSIADQLGGKLGDGIKVSIGQRDKTFRVDLEGLGRTKNMPKFNTEQEAIAFAIQEVIRRGAIIGLRAGTLALIKGEGDLEAQLGKALKFENVFKELEQRANPTIATLDAIAKEFTQLIDIFDEAGASAEDYAKLQELMALKQKEAVEAAFDPIRNLLDDLKSKADTAADAVRAKYDDILSREAAATEAYEAALADRRQAEAAALREQASAFEDMATKLRDFAAGVFGGVGGRAVQFSAAAARSAAQAGNIDALQALKDSAISGASSQFMLRRNLAILQNEASSAAGSFAGKASAAMAQAAAVEGAETLVNIEQLLADMQTAKAAADAAREQMAKLTELAEIESSFADVVSEYEKAKAARDDLLRMVTEAGFGNLIAVQQANGAAMVAALVEAQARATAAADSAAEAIRTAQAAAAAAASTANDNVWTYDAYGMPLSYRGAPGQQAASATEVGKAVADQLRPALITIAKNTAATANTLDDWEVIGQPRERTA